MGEDEMIDVIGGLKAVAASSQVGKSGGSLVSNLLDPLTKEMGEDLRTWYVERRRANIARVAEAAERKLADPTDNPGHLSLKDFQAILDGGSVAEDELATEYFGGVLASSLSGIDRDDRGSSFAKIVSQMSVYQLRTHYLIYSQIKQLHNGTVCSFGVTECRGRLRIYISERAYESALALSSDEDLTGIMVHCVHGLHQLNLIDEKATVVSGLDDLRKEWKDAPDDGMLFQPTSLGADLFMWAHGLGRNPYRSFLHPEVVLEDLIDLSFDGPILRAPKKDPFGLDLEDELTSDTLGS